VFGLGVKSNTPQNRPHPTPTAKKKNRGGPTEPFQTDQKACGSNAMPPGQTTNNQNPHPKMVPTQTQGCAVELFKGLRGNTPKPHPPFLGGWENPHQPFGEHLCPEGGPCRGSFFSLKGDKRAIVLPPCVFLCHHLPHPPKKFATPNPRRSKKVSPLGGGETGGGPLCGHGEGGGPLDATFFFPNTKKTKTSWGGGGDPWGGVKVLGKNQTPLVPLPNHRGGGPPQGAPGPPWGPPKQKLGVGSP